MAPGVPRPAPSPGGAAWHGPLRPVLALALMSGLALSIDAAAQDTRAGTAVGSGAGARPSTSVGQRQRAAPGPKRDEAARRSARPSRGERKPGATAGAPAVPPEAAGPAQLEAAELVYYGPHGCDDRLVLDVSRNDSHPGYVDVKLKSQSWVMKPVASQTGAIRLEDVKGHVLLVQIPFKSMLMNVKSGQRMVDSCQHEIQKTAHEVAARMPAAPGIGILTATSPTAGTPPEGAPAK